MESIRSWISKISGFFRSQEESVSQVQRGNYDFLTGSNSLSTHSGASSFTERPEVKLTKEAPKAPIRIESVLEYWITLEFFKELDTSETNSYNFENLLKKIFRMPEGTKYRLFFGSIRKYDLLLPIYQENDSFLDETWDRTPFFQVDIELVEKKKNKESASVRKMIRYTKGTFIYSPWVFAMSPRSIEQSLCLFFSPGWPPTLPDLNHAQASPISFLLHISL